MSRDYTDEDLDLLRANVYAETGAPVTREAMAVMAALIPDDYIDRVRQVLAASGAPWPIWTRGSFMSAEGVAQVNTLLSAAAIVREWKGWRGLKGRDEKIAVTLEALAEKIAQEDGP